MGCLLKCFVLVQGCGAYDDEDYCVLHSVWRLLGCIDCIAAESVPSGVPELTDFRYSPWVIWAGSRILQLSVELWSGMVLLVGSLRLTTLWIILVKMRKQQLSLQSSRPCAAWFSPMFAQQ